MSQLQSQVRQPDVRNRLLAALPPGDFALLAPSLRPVDLALRQVLHEPNQPITAVHFPEAGMVSMIAALEDGAMQEVGLVGREGVVGLAVVLGADSTPLQALVQAPGPALRLPAADLRAAFGARRSGRRCWPICRRSTSRSPGPRPATAATRSRSAWRAGC